jgi:excisionase family DNA binding protein
VQGEATRREAAQEWLTYRQAEEIFGLSRTTLWKLINASEVEAAHVGRAVRISRASLNAFMRERAITTK